MVDFQGISSICTLKFCRDELFWDWWLLLLDWRIGSFKPWKGGFFGIDMDKSWYVPKKSPVTQFLAFQKLFPLFPWTKSGASKGGPMLWQEYESLAKSIHPQPSAAISKLTSLGWILAYVQLLVLDFWEEQKGKTIRQLLPEPPRMVQYLILNGTVLVLPIEVISWKASNSSERSSLTSQYRYIFLYPKMMAYTKIKMWMVKSNQLFTQNWKKSYKPQTSNSEAPW